MIIHLKMVNTAVVVFGTSGLVAGLVISTIWGVIDSCYPGNTVRKYFKILVQGTLLTTTSTLIGAGLGYGMDHVTQWTLSTWRSRH